MGFEAFEFAAFDFRQRFHQREAGFMMELLDQFTDEDVINLLTRAGQQVGVGEGRPYSKSSNGLGYGLFTIKSVANV